MGPAAAYDRLSALRDFDETKAGVKGLVDAGVTKIPAFFIHPTDRPSAATTTDVQIPVIDLTGVETDAVLRKKLVEEVRRASEDVGFFQVVNHGVPLDAMEAMVESIRRFHEQDVEEKKVYYTRDSNRKFVHNSNFDLFQTQAANWRDSVFCLMAPEMPSAEVLPPIFREIFFKYTNYVRKLGTLLFELLSEALDLDRNHLIEMECNKGLNIAGHYYPACPEPELTFGTSQHCDADFLTILLQDQVGGLQVSLDGQWIDVPPVAGAFVINLGDFMQMISNDKFKSIEHRVLAKNVGPRISVASFFRTYLDSSPRRYGPIMELTSGENPPAFKDVTIEEYITFFNKKGLGGKRTLEYFRI